MATVGPGATSWAAKSIWRIVIAITRAAAALDDGRQSVGAAGLHGKRPQASARRARLSVGHDGGPDHGGSRRSEGSGPALDATQPVARCCRSAWKAAASLAATI